MKKSTIKLSLLLALLLFMPQLVGAQSGASFHFAPVSFSASEGDFFKQSIIVSTPQAVNAVSGKIVFPNDVLEIASVDTGDSIVDFWVSKPSFSNVSGSLTFEGVILNPGFTGNLGNVIDVTYRAKRAGGGEIYFTSGAVLANDGRGTNIVENLDRIGVSVSNEEDNVRLAARETFPQKFSVELVETKDPTDPFRSFQFTTDPSVRIDFYEILIDDLGTLIWPGNRGSLYQTPNLDPGQHSIAVTAVDSSGRIRTDSEVFEIKPLDSLLLVSLPKKAYLGASPWFCRLISIVSSASCVDDFTIEGKAFPNAEVNVMLYNGDDEYEYKGQAGDSGFFSIPVEGVLSAGAYDVYAQAIDERGAKTDEQKVVSLVVDDAGSSGGGVSPIFWVIILAILALAWYLYNRMVSNKMKVQKETLEARMVLREGFDDISEDVSKLKGILSSINRNDPNLSHEEKSMVEEIERRIKEKEADIEKEIKDIDS